MESSTFECVFGGTSDITCLIVMFKSGEGEPLIVIRIIIYAKATDERQRCSGIRSLNFDVLVFGDRKSERLKEL